MANGEGISTTSLAKISLNPLDGWPCPRAQVQLGRFCELLWPRSERVPVCGRVFFGTAGFFSFFFSLMQLWAERWTRSRETVANNRKRTRYDSGSAACISAGDCTSTVTFSTGGPIRSSPTGHRTWSTALNFTSALSLEVMHGGCWIRRFSVSRSRRSTDDLVRDGAVYIVHNSGPLPSVK